MVEPAKIRETAKKYEEENQKFRRFLKNHANEDELDEHFLNFHNELFAKYDCSKCRNCCRMSGPTLEKGEIGPIAAFLGLSEEDFTKKYLTLTDDGLDIKTPCPFLCADGDCRIRDYKPEVCKDFPHTNKSGRLWSLLSIMMFAEECPVVFEIIQRLKGIYHFRGR